MPEEPSKPTLRELAQQVSRLLGGELSPEEIERTLRGLYEAEAKLKRYQEEFNLGKLNCRKGYFC